MCKRNCAEQKIAFETVLFFLAHKTVESVCREICFPQQKETVLFFFNISQNLKKSEGREKIMCI